MQVEQTNLWDNVTKNLQNDTNKGIAAYQAAVPEKNTVFGAKQEHYERVAGVSASGTIDMATYGNPLKEDEDTVVEELQKKDDLTADDRKNEMAVLSNTVSADDLQQMQKDGFSVNNTDSHTVVTVTDKIKAELAKAGVDISAYGDGLTKEQLENITGSAAVATQIEAVLKANDLPATDANVSETVEALAQAASITEISGDMMSYLLKNNLEPSIQNVYKAQYSSANDSQLSGWEIDLSELEPQIMQIIEAAGLEVNESTLSDAKWLLTEQIPLTAEKLQQLTDLKELAGQMEDGSVDWNGMLDSIADTIRMGKRPTEASMITAQRQLEETRLSMTKEAEATIDKLGVEMDYQAMEDTVEGLKEQERAYYRSLLDSAGIEPSEQNIDTMEQTLTVFDALKGMPAYVLGAVDAESSITQVYDAGAQMQQAFEKANESYETLMTAPRSDMGDSMQKAFRNVDAILESMKLDTSAANQRAVRILAYNGLDITEENIMSVKALDEEMQHAFRNLNPATTLEMIRRGENPLDMSMQELNQAAEEIQQETGDQEQERFSKYLWKLEQNHAISEEERSSYIGIYRLIAQVEKSDGAAIGSLYHQGAEITMRNLLSAVRASKKGSMDYSVSDNFDGVSAKASGTKIDEQIAAGFQQNCVKDIMEQITPDKLATLGEDGWMDLTPEQFAQKLEEMQTSEQEMLADEAYVQQQLAMYEQASEVSQDVYAYLDHFDMPNTIANILGVNEMLRHPNQMMETLWKKDWGDKTSVEKAAQMKQQVFEAFGEALKNPTELADAQETLAEVAEHVMDGMIIEDPEVGTLDIRAMQLATAQFKLCAKKTTEESYMIPIQTGDSVTGVSLKIVRGEKKKGAVDILFDSPSMGKVAASFEAKSNRISGMIAVDDEETAKMIREHLDDFADKMKQSPGVVEESVDIHVAYAENLSLMHYEMVSIRKESVAGTQASSVQGENMGTNDLDNTGKTQSTTTEYEVQTSRLYHIAESFIQSIQELTR